MSAMGTYYEEMKEENNWDEADKHYEAEEMGLVEEMENERNEHELITPKYSHRVAEEMADYRKRTAKDFEKEEKNIIRKYLNTRIIEIKKVYEGDFGTLWFLEKELDHLNEECTICKRYSGGQ